VTGARVGGLVAIAVVVLLVVASVAAPTSAAEIAPVERVLIITLPEVAWADLTAADLPALDAFIAEAGLANLATRIGRKPATLADAYLTMGSGTRATTMDLGSVFEVDEQYGDAAAGSVFARRTGREPAGDLVHLDIAAVRRTNAHADYDADPGALGDVLAQSDVERSVIANADLGVDLDPTLRFRRPAGAALMGSDGEVPRGAVAAGRVLQDDPSAPFGVQLDLDAVLRDFRSEWSRPGRKAVLVEASDLSRAAENAAATTTELASQQRADALANADALVAALLAEVDVARDAVVVLAPVAQDAAADLAAVALRAPGLEPGLLDSASTRRAGFVQLADVGPTVLELFGLDAPDGMEGEAFRRAATGGSLDDRVDMLVDAARAADMRDDAIPYATTFLTVAVALLAIGYAVRARLPGFVVRFLPTFAIAVLALVPATFASAVLGVRSPVGLGLGVLVPAIVLTAALEALRRRRPFFAVAIALAVIVGLLAVDLVLGAPLQLNTLFGYSTAVAGRFAGLGNLAFGFFAAATLLLAISAYEGLPRRWALPVACGVLVLGVLVDGLPMLGGDAGGVLAMVPAFGITAMVLTGRTLRVRHVVAWFAIGAATVLAFGLVDLARPRADRTHLARFLERVRDGGFDAVSQLLERRWEASFAGAGLLLFLLLGVALGLVVEYTLLRMENGRRRVRLTLAGRAAAIGIAILALVGLVANDSGAAVPAVILAVAVPVFLLRADSWLGGQA